MNEKREGTDSGKLVVGGLLIAAGALLFADRLDWIHLRRLGDLWPFIPIGIGLVIALGAGGDSGRRRGGLILTFIGVWLLINEWHLFGLHYGESWPLVLVAVGVATLLAPRDEDGRAPAVWLIGGGLIFMAVTQDWVDLRMREVWPLLLILVGIGIVWKALAQGRSRGEASDG